MRREREKLREDFCFAETKFAMAKQWIVNKFWDGTEFQCQRCEPAEQFSWNSKKFVETLTYKWKVWIKIQLFWSQIQNLILNEVESKLLTGFSAFISSTFQSSQLNGFIVKLQLVDLQLVLPQLLHSSDYRENLLLLPIFPPLP